MPASKNQHTSRHGRLAGTFQTNAGVRGRIIPISREARVQIVRDAIEKDFEIILDALKQWRAEKARWVTDLDTRLRLAIRLVRPLVGIKFHEMRKRWYYDKATVRS